MKTLNKKQEEAMARLKDDILVHVVDSQGAAYLTLAHKIRVRIDKLGVIDAWIDNY